MNRAQYINCSALWERICEYAKKAGRVTTRPVLLLYFVMMSDNTPWKDKALIFSTLSYLVLPIDLLDARKFPIIGWFDEIASLAVTYKKVCKNITPEIELKVEDILDRWFQEFTPYELIID